MLKAMLHHKLGRPERDDEDNNSAWDALTAREDPLTSAIFERVAYLEPAIAWSLLRAACMPSRWGRLPEAPPSERPAWWFWPRLSPGLGGINSDHVEPDVLIDWGHHLIIVESKHEGTQSASQWVEEIRAVQADKRFAHRHPLLIAAGGADAGTFDKEAAAAAKALEGGAEFFLLRWNDLRDAAHSLGPTLAPGAACVVQDMISALAAWGYERRLDFDSLPHAAAARSIATTPVGLKGWVI